MHGARSAAGGLAVLVGVAAAASMGTEYQLFVGALVATQVIAALSLDLLMGHTGQLSLGQAAFVGSGAYAAAYLASWGVPFPLTLIIAVPAAAALAALAGSPSLRIRGLQVAATTLAFGVMAERLLFARPWDVTSTSGMALVRPSLLSDDRTFFLFALGCLALVLLVDASVRSSRVGRAMAAVRDREDTAAAWGIGVGTTKVVAYAISGAIAGVGGALHGYLIERVTPDSYSVWASLGLVAIVIVGGLGSRTGVTIAAVAFTALPEVLRSAQTYAPMIGAVLLMLMPVVRPEGLGYVFDRLGRLIPGRTRRVVTSRSSTLDRPRRSVVLSIPLRRLLVSDHVTVSRGGNTILRGVDLEVRRGEIVGLIGPNGAGKTTFFNAVSGFVHPSEGRITFRGRNLLELPPHARAGLGIVRTFQHMGLCLPQTVWENVLLAQYDVMRYPLPESLVRTPRVRRIEAQAIERAEAALELLGVADVRDDVIASLPNGRQRLVEVAAAVAAGPELLLLDEPAAGMDPDETICFAEQLLHLHDELDLTMLVIEHHVPFVARISDHIYVMAEGRVLAEGPPGAIQRDPRVIESYLGEPRHVREEAGVA